jgi:hypothetical protein
LHGFDQVGFIDGINRDCDEIPVWVSFKSHLFVLL